jgi:hypothetical protein
MGDPIDGLAAVEALAAGCVVLLPRFSPPRKLHRKPIKRRWSSQHPTLEAIGAPHVFVVDYDDATALAETLAKVRSAQASRLVVEAFAPSGFYRRVETLLADDFCTT